MALDGDGHLVGLLVIKEGFYRFAALEGKVKCFSCGGAGY
jgi:hypothetical protein